MSLNQIIHTDRTTLSFIVANVRSGVYFVDASFQRRLIWTEKQKIRIIETILMGYPIPEIYLWQQNADPTSGRQLFSIVDGQQRLTAITQYVSNEWPLKSGALDEANREADFSGKKWSDLPDQRKTALWNYVLNVRQIPSEVSQEQIRKVFVRLNETDRSLNPQEMRHAEFSGEFIKNAERLANLPLWGKWAFFSSNDARRMLDIEYCSSLLIYLRFGLVDEGVETINGAYDLFNDTYEDQQQDYDEVCRILNLVDLMTSSSEALQKLFLKNVHLFSLFVVIHRAEVTARSRRSFVKRLESFAKAYSEDQISNETIENYRQGASSRTRSKANREKRVSSLLKWINSKKK